MKTLLYTCENGKKLYEIGEPFWAWKHDNPEFLPTRIRYKIEVDAKDIAFNETSYKVINSQSIEFLPVQSKIKSIHPKRSLAFAILKDAFI